MQHKGEYLSQKYIAHNKEHILPPGLKLYPMGQLHLTLGRFFTTSARIQPKRVYCKTAWMGEPTFSFLKPVNSEREEPSELTFEVHCSLWHFHLYLEDCASLELFFLQDEKQIGSATLALSPRLSKQLYDGSEPFKELDEQIQIMAKGRVIATVLVNLYTTFDHQLAGQLKNIVPQLVSQRRNAWTKSIARAVKHSQEQRGSLTQVVNLVSQPNLSAAGPRRQKKAQSRQKQERQRQGSKQRISPQTKQDLRETGQVSLQLEHRKSYDPSQYLEQEGRSGRPSSVDQTPRELVFEVVQKKVSLEREQFYREKERGPEAGAVVAQWLKYKSRFVLKVTDFMSYHPNLTELIASGQIFFVVQLPALKWTTRVPNGTLKGDFFKLGYEGAFPIQDHIDFSRKLQHSSLLLKLFLLGTPDLQVGRAVFAMNRIWAANGEGQYSVSFINRVPLERLLLKGPWKGGVSEQFKQAELGQFRLATSFQLPSEIAGDTGKMLALYSRCKLFQMLLEIHEYRTERPGGFHCRYKSFCSGESLRTKQVRKSDLNFRHRAVLPVPPEVLLRMESQPFIIEVWRKEQSEQLEGLLKLSLAKVPLSLLTKGKLVNQNSPALLDVYPQFISNQFLQVKSLMQSPRGELYVALSFGTIPQIQRLMDEDTQNAPLSQPPTLPTPNLQKTLISEQVLSRAGVRVTLLGQDPKPTPKTASSVMTQVEQLPSQDESVSDVTPENSFLDIKNQTGQSNYLDKEELQEDMPTPRVIEQVAEVMPSQTALYLSSLSSTILELRACCPELKERVLPKIKDALQFGFVDTKRLSSVLLEEGVSRALLERVLDIVDCSRQGLSFVSTLWDYMKSCEIYGSVAKNVVDTNALATRLIAYFRSKIRENLNNVLVREVEGRISRQVLWEELGRRGVRATEEEMRLVFREVTKEDWAGVVQLQRWAREGRARAREEEPSRSESEDVLLLTQLINRNKSR